MREILGLRVSASFAICIACWTPYAVSAGSAGLPVGDGIEQYTSPEVGFTWNAGRNYSY